MSTPEALGPQLPQIVDSQQGQLPYGFFKYAIVDGHFVLVRQPTSPELMQDLRPTPGTVVYEGGKPAIDQPRFDYPPHDFDVSDEQRDAVGRE